MTARKYHSSIKIIPPGGMSRIYSLIEIQVATKMYLGALE
jgi:hypothetical protein